MGYNPSPKCLRLNKNFFGKLNERFLVHRSTLSNLQSILPTKMMKINQDIWDEFKLLVESCRCIIDECTDSNLKNSILNFGLNFRLNSFSSLLHNKT